MKRKTKKSIKFIAAERRLKCGQQWYLTVKVQTRTSDQKVLEGESDV